jgi:hypothetical protein
VLVPYVEIPDVDIKQFQEVHVICANLNVTDSSEFTQISGSKGHYL